MPPETQRMFQVFAPFAQILYYRRTWIQICLFLAGMAHPPYQLSQIMRSLVLTFAFISSAAILFVGCGGGSTSEPAASSPAPAASAATTALGSASVNGSISFTGTAPVRPRIRQDRECVALNTDPVLGETVVVNDNGSLRNVFVYVKEGLGDYNFAVPDEPVQFDQNGCVYAPHIFGIQVGQTLEILNSDPLMHNLHALAEENRPFNFGMPNQGDTREQSFRVPEVMLHIKCDVHPWMSAYVGVVDHPFHGVSDDTGGFSISQLPAGSYVVEAWHEEYGTLTQNVTVTDGESVSLDFSFGD